MHCIPGHFSPEPTALVLGRCQTDRQKLGASAGSGALLDRQTETGCKRWFWGAVRQTDRNWVQALVLGQCQTDRNWVLAPLACVHILAGR
jgi:hypothetical protein